MPIGYTFDPTQEARLRRSLNRPNGGQLNPMSQRAIQIMSLRLPNILGGRPVAPSDLLKPQVGGNGSPSAVASSVMRTSGADRPSSLSSSAPALNTPSLSSPASVPFAASMPSASRSSTEGSQLSALVRNALGSSPRPTITPAAGDGYRDFPQTPIPTNPPPAPPRIETAPAPVSGLNDLLDWLTRGGTFGSDAGSFGMEG